MTAQQMLLMGTLAMCLASSLAAHSLVAQEPQAGRGDGVASETGPRADHLDFVLFDDGRAVRLQLRIDIDGRDLAAAWDDVFQQIHRWSDHNGDGVLSRDEAACLPTPLAVRQVLWGQVRVSPQGRVPWISLDCDQSSSVTCREMTEFYRRGGLGHAIVGIGSPVSTRALNAGLQKLLDQDGDGRVSSQEADNAPQRLARADLNGDALIGPGEIVPRISYPGALGATMLRSPTVDDVAGLAPKSQGTFPLLLLPSRADDLAWTRAIVARLDGNGDRQLSPSELRLSPRVVDKLDADADHALTESELSAWRSMSADVAWRIRVPVGSDVLQGADGNAVRLTEPGKLAGVNLSVRTAEGKLPAMLAAMNRRYVDRFREADIDANGALSRAETNKPPFADFAELAQVGDRNGDARLDEGELRAWCALQQQIGRAHVLVSVLDFPHGLFELLDQDHNGGLSTSELRKSSQRLAERQLSDGGVPRTMLITVSQGHPVNALGTPAASGPSWFVAMDRNGDQVVSRDEFAGNLDHFLALDQDGDALLSPAEAVKD